MYMSEYLSNAYARKRGSIMLHTVHTGPEVSERTIQHALDANLKGFTIGRRLSIPFRCDLISILVGKRQSFVGMPNMITDFSPTRREISVVEHPNRMDLYFERYGSLQDELGHWKGTLVVTCCEVGDDIFDENTHRRIEFKFRDDSSEVIIRECCEEL